ncbi:hypothetical protein KVR01_001668 [Diaporthe batatas]|uniref:uncharacterized protein n=1 Tax=Diaporthe batatas TaxID=748121 RepID=UPI001D036DD2|nr:uncharacterized protein KVR01_001668 [Diaporthe batatas]KAG8168919.1 hypothetical protein KVR01_001668 [Diaporthe batatas]
MTAAGWPLGSLKALSHMVQSTPRRFLRLSVLVTVTLLFLVFLLKPRASTSHHPPFEPPATNIIVHGDPVDGIPEPSYSLIPFPDSPRQSSTSSPDAFDSVLESFVPRPWLAAVICSVGDFARRRLIRSTWMSLYRNIPFDGRFVVANPGSQWTEAVAEENRTYGDMIVLENIAEDDITANTVKTLEFYKWLVSRSPRRYEFVSKMDTDVWLNAHGFWNRFLLPQMGRKAETLGYSRKSNRTVIGELYWSETYDLVFPHGAMYTASWDMVELLASLQEQFNVLTGEDMAVAVLLLKSKTLVNFINFRGSEKFDFDEGDTRGDGTAWARPETHPDATYHALVAGSNPIAVHQLKSEESFLKVAECFDEQGAKSGPGLEESTGISRQLSWSTSWHDFWTSIGLSGQYDSRFDRIPDSLWSQEDGNWICDGIWDLGKTKEGHVEG